MNNVNNGSIANASEVADAIHEAARRNRQENEGSTGNNAEAAAEAAAEADETDEAKQMRASDVAKLPLGDLVKVGTLVEAVLQQTGEHIEAIQRDQQQVTTAAEAMGEAAKVKDDLWSHVMAIVSVIFTATEETPALRTLVYSHVMEPFLSDKNRSTAKSYASTGRNVLVKLLTDKKMKVDDVAGMKYSEIRDELRPTPTARQAEARATGEKIREQLAFITRNADKYGTENEQDAASRLQRIAEAVEREYNAVKSAKDRDSAKAKAARELADLKQQSPREGAQTETTDAKPEVVRAKQDDRQRQVFKSESRH